MTFIKSFQHLQFRKKILVYVVSVSFISLFLASLSFIVFDSYSTRQILVKSIVTKTEILGKTSASALLFQDPDFATTILDGLHADRRIIAACIYSDDGELFARSMPDTIGYEFPAIQPEGYDFHGTFIDIFTPVTFEEAQIGTIYIRADISELHDRIKNFILIALAVLILSLLAAISLSEILSRKITRPVLELEATARMISEEKDYSRRALKQTDDEVGILTDSFNEMLDQIQMRDSALRQSENEIRSLLDSTAEAIFGMDTNGNCTFANSSFLTLLGYPALDEVLGENMHSLIHHSRTDGIPHHVRDCPMCQASQKGEYIQVDTVVLWRADGTSFPAEYWSHPKIENNRIVGAVATFVDISSRKKLETQLRQAQKMEAIGNLAGGIAHDFNNILSSILGFTELALDDVKKDSLVEDNLQEVYSAGKRAKDLVRQILTFARQSEEVISPVRVDLVVEEVLKFIRSSIPTTIEIKKRIESKSHIMGNPTQVHQLLMNLCTNAAHAMEEGGGILTISLKDTSLDRHSGKNGIRKHKSYIELLVSDTGTGIPPDILDSIFEPYFTTKEPGEGTGLGLAMVQGIVDSYGGEINVKSHQNTGTVFEIYLPVTDKLKSHHSYKHEDLPQGTERILFVDDEEPITKMGRQMLEVLGYQVRTETSSTQALDVFASKPEDFDLIITDMTMPNMTGDKLAVELMKIRPDIPIVLCTGYSKKISSEDASRIGLKAIAFKPIIKADLAATVRNVLDEA